MSVSGSYFYDVILAQQECKLYKNEPKLSSVGYIVNESMEI